MKRVVLLSVFAICFTTSAHAAMVIASCPNNTGPALRFAVGDTVSEAIQCHKRAHGLYEGCEYSTRIDERVGWVALAQTRPPQHRVGVAWNAGSRAEAISRAMQQCRESGGRDCMPAWVQNDVPGTQCMPEALR